MAKGTTSEKVTASELQAVTELQNELEQVQSQLMTAADELYSPLSDLVRSQLKAATPLVHAAIVLTAGVSDPDTDDLRKKRILLATALEMLYVALHIHRRLLTNTGSNGDHDPDKSRLGSIILAGDYCFSRSAILAAQTDNPDVVMIFATALKTVNEGHLRQHFTQEWIDFDENQKLFEAGARAAATLLTQDEAIINKVGDFGREIATQIQSSRPTAPPVALDLRLVTLLAPARQLALQRWLLQNYPMA